MIDIGGLLFQNFAAMPWSDALFSNVPCCNEETAVPEVQMLTKDDVESGIAFHVV